MNISTAHVLRKARKRPIGYITPGGYIKTSMGWRKATAADREVQQQAKTAVTSKKAPSSTRSVVKKEKKKQVSPTKEGRARTIAELGAEVGGAIPRDIRRVLGMKDHAIYDEGPSGVTFSLVYSLPRELRHPDEYGGEEKVHARPDMQRIMEADDKLWQIMGKFEKKYKKINFDSVGASYGGGIRVPLSPLLTTREFRSTRTGS